MDIRTILVADLGTKSRSLMDLSGRFRQYHDSLKIATFYETKKTPIPGWMVKSRVVGSIWPIYHQYLDCLIYWLLLDCG